MHATNYAESAIGSALFLNQALPSITEWHIALFTAAPNEEGTGGTEVSTSETGYARQRLDPGANWAKRPAQDGSGQTVFYNAVAVQFAAATLNWGTISHFGLVDQSGNLWIVAPLIENKLVSVDQAPVFLAGELEIAVG